MGTDFSGDLTLTGMALGYSLNQTTGAMTPQKQNIKIGGSFQSGTISVPAFNAATAALGGIAPLGQVIVGANVVSGNPQWSGTVKISQTTLANTPAYTNTAASIGGGAAGFPGRIVAGTRAGYDVHNASSFPAPNGVFAVRRMQLNGLSGDPECVDVPFTPSLRFYGPVTRVTPSPQDLSYVASTVRVQRWTGSSWIDDAATYGTPDTIAADNFRQFVVNRVGAWAIGQYRLVRKDGALKCLDVNGLGGTQTQDVADFMLPFELVDSCELEMVRWFDRNDDGALDNADVVAQAAEPADFNLDGGADSRDMFLLLLALTRYGG